MISCMKTPIYLDYAATTPVDSQVADAMFRHMTMDGVFGNAGSSTHVYGAAAEKAVNRAREQVASLLNADAREIIFTSGATESINLALKGPAAFYAQRGQHIITSAIEHKATLDTCKALEDSGCRVTYVQPLPNGALDLAAVENAIADDTILLSFMHVNNETGVINDIAALAELAQSHGVKLHVDAAQSVGKLPLDLAALPVDYLSLSAHKFYGPKGSGALFVRRQPRARLQPQLHGGGQQQGLRAGTLPTQQIVGLGEACALAQQSLVEESARLTQLRDQLWAGLSSLNGVLLNGTGAERAPHILNMSFAGVMGESLLLALDELAVSSGSACTSASAEPSYVLRALGRDDALAESSLRFSLGRDTTADDIDRAVQIVRREVQRLRDLAP